MKKKNAPSRYRTATQGRPCGLPVHDRFYVDRLVTIGAKIGKRGVRLQVGSTCPWQPAHFSLYAHAYCHSNNPQTFKGTHKSTRRSFRCQCKNGLAVFFLTIGTTTILWAAGFGATLGPDGGYSVAFQALFLYFLERLWNDLRGNDFTFVIWTTGQPRNWRWTWSISEVLASFRVRQWREWPFEWFYGRCGGKCLVFCFVENTSFYSLFSGKHVRDFTFC